MKNSIAKSFPLDGPRVHARRRMRLSVGELAWDRNEAVVGSIRERIAAHPVATHPAITTLCTGELALPVMQQIHLEYRHAIVQIFTDALLMAQFQTRQLEPRLHPASKMDARFLLNLNDLDEFGFVPGDGPDGYYRGHPGRAHYSLYEDILDDYGLTLDDRQAHRPSDIAGRVREFLEASYDDLTSLSVLLAVAEQEVVLFSPPLRQATIALGIGIEGGYYHYHGSTDDESTEAADDDHEADLWCLLTQSLVEGDDARVTRLALDYCDLWDEFWSFQMKWPRMLELDT